MMEQDDSQRAEQWAYETFSKCYPHESYEMDKKKFCDYVRTKNPDMTDEQIKQLLETT